MVKIKIIETGRNGIWFDKTRKPVSDFCYCVYFLGILVHSVTIRNIQTANAHLLFYGRDIYFMD